MSTPTVTREQLLEVLQNGWGTYVERFHRAPPDRQAASLGDQGYARLADLLAHIIAWWSDAERMIAAMLVDPDLASPDYDVDAFNAQAVARLQGTTEPGVIKVFEDTRCRLMALIAGLPDEAWQNEHITGRLRIEVVGHLAEHEFSG